MPQADLSYSASLALDSSGILEKIETTIAAHDATSGACKGRAFPIEHTHHDHVLLRLRMLRKDHRDDAFMSALLTALQQELRPYIPTPAILGIELGFLEPHYASLTLS